MERFNNGEEQRQLSKEFVRQWLIDRDFQGKEGQQMPEMPEEFVSEVSERYIELYEKITGDSFIKEDPGDVNKRIEKNIRESLGSV